ncbi:DNA mismatch repair protein MutL [Trichoderma compactum]
MDEMETDSAPGGNKRKAEDEIEAPKSAQRIRALDPDVVNKIAAGEIIVTPVQALKELIENAVDAGSTLLDILVKDGGLKLLQITDNGSGIEKEDLEILCVRHTTSKISTFEDLSSIATYGFRGEALASISHIAHLEVTTRTKETPYAWRANYRDGKPVPGPGGLDAEPRMVAGRLGTQISVEDLFFNVPTRLRAFRNHADEYHKIIDMVGRYAVHCKGVGFSCRKHWELPTISVKAEQTLEERIRYIYGGSVANEMIELFVSDDRWGFSVNGYVTNANYHIKKTTFVLFINHRCVESSTMKKALEQIYTGFLPKGGRPFIYLSLEIDPARVDVNVHPTKREVYFLNEEQVIQAICKGVESELSAVDASRKFSTKVLVPEAKPVEVESVDEDDGDAAPKFTTPALRKVRRNSNDLVRTDKSQSKITAMFSPAGPADKADSPARTLEDEPWAVPEPTEYTTIDRKPMHCQLRSIRELRHEVREEINEELTEIITSHSFVGVVDEKRRLAAIQAGVKLYLIDYGHACFEYFYQLGLSDFGNFGVINLIPPLDLRDLLLMGAEAEKQDLGLPEGDNNFDVIVSKVANQLIEWREMLQEYFSLEITPTGELASIPLLVKGYTPSLGRLPQFLIRLGPHVNWRNEKLCFKTFLSELASFYVPESLPTSRTGEIEETEGLDPVELEEVMNAEAIQDVRVRRQHIRWNVEHVFFPAFKSRLVPTNGLMERGVLEAANLKGLYKVFERC